MIVFADITAEAGTVRGKHSLGMVSHCTSCFYIYLIIDRDASSGETLLIHTLDVVFVESLMGAKTRHLSGPSDSSICCLCQNTLLGSK